MRYALSALLLFACFSLAGCGGDPPVYPITGKVTYAGKAYPRLIVNFYPPEGTEATQFNVGVGETDAQGTLRLNSTGGDGVAAGTYRVTFTLMLTPEGGNVRTDPNEKPDDVQPGIGLQNVVPIEYQNPETTPVTFEVKKGGTNEFIYDIPVK